MVNSTLPTDSKAQVRAFLMNYQDRLTSTLEQLDANALFQQDIWQSEHLGGGRTRVITDGALWEQGGVNFSEIQGNKIPASLLGQRPDLDGHSFWGAGVSLVLHPRNPLLPTVHLNYRYFEAGNTWWFGGGADLTPCYVFETDAQHWHQTYKDILDQHDQAYYPAFKYWCDEYFYNHHRQESRGIGGTFFDYQDGTSGKIIKADFARQSAQSDHPALSLKQEAKSWTQMLALVQDNANGFFTAYIPIAQQRHAMSWTEQQRQFQLYRRGRYVEFNLLHDRGTLFGLQSKGRVESILMSLPPLVRWQYNYKADSGTAEADLTEKYLQRAYDWVGCEVE